MTVRADGDQHELQQLRCWRLQVCMPKSLQAQSQGTQKHVNNTQAAATTSPFLLLKFVSEMGLLDPDQVFFSDNHIAKPTIFIKYI